MHVAKYTIKLGGQSSYLVMVRRVESRSWRGQSLWGNTGENYVSSL